MRKVIKVLLILTLIFMLSGCDAKTNPEKSSEFTINNYHPIVFCSLNNQKSFSQVTILGGFKDNKWADLDSFSYKLTTDKQDSESGNFVNTDLIKGNESFKFYSGEKFIKTSAGTKKKPLYYISPASGQKILTCDIEPVTTDNLSTSVIYGINGTWNALPRIAEKTGDDKYTVDLDNDGKKEIITFAKSTQAGSMIYATLNMDKNGLTIPVLEAEYAINDVFNIAMLDLNGDGKLEIIAYQTGSAGFVSVYEFEQNQFKQVLIHDSGE